MKPQGGAAGRREENRRASIWRLGRKVLKGGGLAPEHGHEDKSDPPMQPRWGMSVTWDQWPPQQCLHHLRSHYFFGEMERLSPDRSKPAIGILFLV